MREGVREREGERERERERKSKRESLIHIVVLTFS